MSINRDELQLAWVDGDEGRLAVSYYGNVFATINIEETKDSPFDLKDFTELSEEIFVAIIAAL